MLLATLLEGRDGATLLGGEAGVLARGLLVGFHVLAIDIALALLWVPYAQYVYTHRISGRVVIFCLGAACALLWTILPRIDRFEPPGPPLFRENNPHTLCPRVFGATFPALIHR